MPKHIKITQLVFTWGVTAIILIITPTANSQQPTPHAITREQAVRYALDNSESIRMVKESSAALRAEGKQITAFTLPRLTLTGGYTELGDNAAESPFIPSPERDISAQISVSQIWYAGGRIRSSVALSKTIHNQADILEASGERDIRKQVKAAFDAVLYQHAGLDILKDRVNQRQNELEDAQDLKDAGMVTSLDVRQAGLSLNVAEDQLKSGEATYQEALINFNLSIGRSGSEELLVPVGDLENIPDLKTILHQLETLLATDDFLDIKFVQTAADAARLEYEIARGERLPEVFLVASGKSGGEKPDEMDESWNIGIQASWTILDGGLVRQKTAAAKANLQSAQEDLSKTRKALAGEVEKLGVNIRSLEQRIALQREAVELSQKNYEDARGHYRAGTITLTRLGEFNLSYAETRFNLLRLFFLQREQITYAEALIEK